MTSRKKLTVTLTVVALVVVAAVVAVVGVLAATQQTVTSAIHITFTAVDIDGTVSAKYLIQDKEEEGVIGATSATAQGITFKADGTKTGSLDIGSDGELDIKGDSQALYVAYQFTRQEIDYSVAASFDNTVFKMEYFDETQDKWVEVGQSSTTLLTNVSAGAGGSSLVTRFSVKDAKTSIKDAVQLTVSFVLAAVAGQG